MGSMLDSSQRVVPYTGAINQSQLDDTASISLNSVVVNRHSPFYKKAVQQGKKIKSNRNAILLGQGASLSQNLDSSARFNFTVPHASH